MSYISRTGTRSSIVSLLYGLGSKFPLLYVLLNVFVLHWNVRKAVSIVICSLPLGVCYVLAIVVTVQDWHKLQYDIRSNFNQILPHIG